MKRTIIYAGMFFFIGLVLAGLSAADQCEEAKKMIDWGVSSSPGAMNEQMFQKAVAQCPEDADNYKRIARYYKSWFEKELQPEKQVEFKRKAVEYYEKAVSYSTGSMKTTMRSELSELKSKADFSKIAMRRLRPSEQGATGTGITIKVFFELDSYNLTNTAQEHLNILGEYLVENQSTSISLEGHTDRRGEHDYNNELSMKRAEKAKAYLVNKYGVENARILTIGHGFDRLADPMDPYSSENRRVEVIKLSE
jgi:outer membrane protein OmpA-like peptidoglycan-associated protein